MNGVEVREGADKRPEIVGGSEDGAGEIEIRYLAGNGREYGDNSGGGSIYSVVEFDTLEVGEGQASISGSFKKRCREISGVVADNSLLAIREEFGCGSRELAKGVDLLSGMETDGAETVVPGGGKPVSGCEGTGVERLGIVVEVVDDLVDEL